MFLDKSNLVVAVVDYLIATCSISLLVLHRMEVNYSLCPVRIEAKRKWEFLKKKVDIDNK